MWLRLGKRSRWKDRDATNSEHVAQAAEDLKPRASEDVSVYRVENLLDARRIASAHAITQRPKPDSIDFVLLPDDALSDLGLVPNHRPMSELPALLRELHYEIPSLQDEWRRTAIAARTLSSDNLTVERLGKPAIAEQWKLCLSKEASVLQNASEDWTRFLDDYIQRQNA
jgi:hypothetical protein